MSLLMLTLMSRVFSLVLLMLCSCEEEVGHSSKSIMVGRISESRTLFYRDHEINMAGFKEEVSINVDHFYLLFFSFAI